MKIVDNEEEIQNRANWLYCSNGGKISKFECAKKAVEELTSANFVRDLCVLADMTLNDYVYGIAKNIKGE